MDFKKLLAPIILRSSDPKISKAIYQNFSIPQHFVFYISKNIFLPKLYRKLIQICKYFPEKNQIFFLHCFYYSKEEGGYSTCNQLKKRCCDGRHTINGKATNQLNINVIPQIIWVENVLSIDCKNSGNFFGALIPRLKCTAVFISLHNATITLKEFQSICKFAKDCHLRASKIMDENDEKVSQPDILKQMPKLLEYSSTMVPDFTAAHLKEIIKSSKFKNLKEFSIWDLTENLDIDEGIKYLKENKTLKIRLTFGYNAVSDEYKKKIDDITVEILKDKRRKYFPPYLFCPTNFWTSDSPNGELRYLHENYKVKRSQKKRK